MRSPCPTFNKLDTFAFFKETLVDVPAEHDPSDPAAALRLAMEADRVYSGLIYERSAQVFGTRTLPTAMRSREEALQRLFDRFS